jgi:ABC-type nitrate/sulfonate/bicarbonate transport system ATPase subunit
VAGIELRGLSHTYGGRRPLPVLRDVTLDVPEGAFVSIVGPSGCGKSTILRILSGLLTASRGEALVDGVSVRGNAGLAAYMPQKDLLLPWRRVLGNATLGARVAGVPAKAANEQALGLMEQFGLTGFERSWPAQLSGGMRQRVALLRTFLHPARTLLLDEPFGALDAITRREMQNWLQEVWQRDRRTVLFITHDVDEALLLSDTVYVMSPRPGELVDRVEVTFARPRTSALVVDHAFVELKARLLAALERR